MNIVSLLLIIVPILLSLWICHLVAKKRGLNQRHWQIMALLFGPLAIPFVFLARHQNADKDNS